MSEERERLTTVHRMTRRCLGWDYTQPCIYMITLVLADRGSKALGEVVVDARSEDGLPVAAHCESSALGQEIVELWKRFAEFTPEIKPLYCQLMPDHLHAILQVVRPMRRPLGNAIGGFKTGCEKIYQALSRPAQDKALSRPFVGACRVSAAKAAEIPRLFAPGFQDTILFHAGQLDNMFNYLRENPLRLAIKRAAPEVFRVVGELAVALPGRSGDAVGFFSALGNRFLLQRPLVQVQVSRRLFGYKRVVKPGGGLKIAKDADGEPIAELSTPEFEARREELFAAAKHSAALLSPCVSDGERQIAREALAAGLPLVTMANKGFSKLQKPSGRYFEACAAGKLLMLAPVAWSYQPGEKPMTRFDATAMNRLCQWIAGDGAAEINYHGMRPANVDELALKAVSKGVES